MDIDVAAAITEVFKVVLGGLGGYLTAIAIQSYKRRQEEEKNRQALKENEQFQKAVLELALHRTAGVGLGNAGNVPVPEPSREEWFDSDRHWNADLFNIVSQISLIDAEHLRTLNTY